MSVWLVGGWGMCLILLSGGQGLGGLVHHCGDLQQLSCCQFVSSIKPFCVQLYSQSLVLEYVWKLSKIQKGQPIIITEHIYIQFNSTATEAFSYAAKRYFLTKNTAAVLMTVTRCCSVSMLEGSESWVPSMHDDNHANTSLMSWKLGAVKFSRETSRGKPRERRCSTKSEKWDLWVPLMHLKQES